MAETQVNCELLSLWLKWKHEQRSKFACCFSTAISEKIFSVTSAAHATCFSTILLWLLLLELYASCHTKPEKKMSSQLNVQAWGGKQPGGSNKTFLGSQCQQLWSQYTTSFFNVKCISFSFLLSTEKAPLWGWLGTRGIVTKEEDTDAV